MTSSHTTATPAPNQDALAELEGGGLRWQVLPELEETVRQLIIPNFDRLRDLPGARVVKENRLRTVLRLPTEAGVLFVKTFRYRGLSDEVKALWRSKARQEWQRSRRCYAGGVATARPAFVAEGQVDGRAERCALATFEVPGSVDYARALDAARALPEAESAARRRTLAAKLAELTHSLFQLGALHGDYHIGNLLLGHSDALFVIDLNAISYPPLLLKSQKLSVLGRLAVSHSPFDPKRRKTARAELGWLAESYAELDASLGSGATLERALLRSASRHEHRRLKSRGRRCLVSSSLYERERRWNRQVFRRRDVDPEELAVALDAPALEVLQRSPRGRVELIEAPPGMAQVVAALTGRAAPRRLVRKVSEPSKLRSRLATVIAGGKGRRSWRAARALEVREIRTAFALALVEEQPLRLITTRSVLFLEHIEGATELHRFVSRVLRRGPQQGGLSASRRFAFSAKLAQLLVRLQETQVCHHDLAAQNILVRSVDGEDEPILIDLDTVRLRKLKSRDLRRNLVHLGDLPPQASPTDKARFFRDYRRAGGDRVLAEEFERWTLKGFQRLIAKSLVDRRQTKRRRLRRRAGLQPD